MTVTITALTNPTQGTSQAFGINGTTVVGEETPTGGKAQAFVAINGVANLMGGNTPSAAYAVNYVQEIVGQATLYGDGYAQTWYQNFGSAADNLTSQYSAALAVNSGYQYAGWGSTNSGENEAFLDSHGAITFLGTLNGAVAPGTSATQLTVGPISSSAQGISDSGVIVGYSVYSSSSTATHAFSWVSGTMTDLGTLAGGTQSAAMAIDSQGEIVGWSNNGAGSTHAVTWTNGTIADLGTLSGYSGSQALAIDSTGRVVGNATNAAGTEHAVMWQNGTITDLNSLLAAGSGWVLTTATGITSQGLIVGTGLDNGVQTAFELSLNSQAVPLTTVSAVVSAFQSGTLTTPATINDSSANIAAGLDSLEKVAAAGLLGSIAPTESTLFVTAQQISSDALALAKVQNGIGFYVDGTTVTNISVTAMSGHPLYVLFNGSPSQYSITAGGNGSNFTVTDLSTGRTSTDIVNGAFRLDFGDGSTIYPLQAGSVAAISQVGAFDNLGTPTPIDINSQGVFSGILGSTSSPSSDKAVLWSGATGVERLTPLSGATASEAYHIDNNGDAVGESFTPTYSGSTTGIFIASLWTAADIASKAQPTSLGTLSGDVASLAIGINDNGQVVGSSFASGTSYRGFLWQNGSMTNLGSLGGQQVRPYAINDSGQVVGISTIASGQSHAFLWQNGSMSDLGMLPGGTSAQAVDLNAQGVIVGSTTQANGFNMATEWKSGQVIGLGILPGGAASAANEINGQGWVVGQSSISGGAAHAVLWADGTMIDLNSLLPASAQWVLTSANAINDNGMIAGLATYAGFTTAYTLDLLTPPTVSAATAVLDYNDGLVYGPMTLTDSAAIIQANLGGLQTIAGAGDLATIKLSDSSVPTLTVTAAQFIADAAVLNDISSAHAVVVQMSGNAAQHNFSSDNWTGASALQFADQTVIVAATPGTNAVTTGNVTELYSAVLAREPDVGGLAYYQNYLKANPNTSLLTFAEFFLQSSEYTSAHSYAQTTAGETQFVTDSYQNLLHRAPSASEVNFYLTNVLEKPGTQLQNHAQMLVYFSASTEFLGDVQITAANPASAQHWLVLT